MLYKRGEVWWTRFRHRGQQVSLSTGQRALSQAKIEARRKRVAFEEEHGPGGRGAGVTLANLEELDVERARRKGMGEIRIATISNLWRQLEKHLGEHRDVMDLTPEDLDAYEGARRAETYHGEHVKGQTIARERQALKRGLRLAKRDKLIPRLPFDWDDLDAIERDAPRARQAAKLWPLETIQKVLAELSTKAQTAGYDRMLKLILETGLRLEEFRRCRPEWIRPAPEGSRPAALLAVPASSSKTGDPRTLPLSSESVATINELWPRFVSRKFNHALVLASEAAGLQVPVTPRDLRAFFLSHASRLGDPLAAQRLGGHRNLATTGLYLESEDARAIEAGVRVVDMIRSENVQKCGTVVCDSENEKERKAQ